MWCWFIDDVDDTDDDDDDDNDNNDNDDGPAFKFDEHWGVNWSNQAC